MTTVLHPRSAAASPRLVSVNGHIISTAAITREIQYHPATSPAESWRRAAEALILRELLLGEIRRNSMLVAPLVDEKGRRETTEEAQIRTLVEQEVRVPAPTEEELRRYYQANRAKFRSLELFEARHILIAARASDAAAFDLAREKALALASEIEKNPASFDELARAHSDCASSGQSGRLGQFSLDEMTTEFAVAVDQLAEGETTRTPVETRYGLHIIRLDRRIPGVQLPFESVASRISEYLTDRARRTATAQYLARLVSRAVILGVEMAGAEAHHVN
jgi:peptidyl-prolyl cis-trans isomerase C